MCMANSLFYQKKRFHIGDTLAVYQKVTEGDKERTQIFEGVLIAVSGKELNKSLTVRKIAVGGIGVERIWPLFSPHITAIKRVKKGHARRAKLYYLRGRLGSKATKVKEKTPAKETTVHKSKASHAKKVSPRTPSRKPRQKVSRK
ncbi:MAG: 50S ribosomal protein L19, partial [Candidatus Chisholmbacteria bacterium]|nr:50S ribosomal protein L19 [Candidatus Chisholmbacteria bacterium]